MQVRFWGTRGSLAKSSPNTLRYGGNTSCVEVRSAAGTLVVIDCGTGAHGLGQSLMASADGPVRGSLLISHTHWDHIQGIPFFAPLFVPGNEWDIYAPRGLGQSLRDTLSGQMQYTYFPVTLESMGATIRYHDLVEGELGIDDITVHTRYLNHPALTLGYRLEADGACMVYACDHEPVAQRAEPGDAALAVHEARHVEFLANADLVIHDSQYTPREYRTKVGWGHSTAEYAVAVSHAANVRELALTHHDPSRTDNEIDRIVEGVREMAAAKGSPLRVVAAAEGQTIVLDAAGNSAPRTVRSQFSAVGPVDSAIVDHTAILYRVRPEASAIISSAAAAERLRLVTADSVEAVERIVGAAQPSLVILDAGAPAAETLAIQHAIQAAVDTDSATVPVAMVAAHDESTAAMAPAITQWLMWPFTEAHARTMLRALVLRMKCMWAVAPPPADEAERLQALRDLEVLDTAPDERFDRITRIAATALDVPIALVSLVDEDRQWFKSSTGLSVSETPRDAALCAHAILDSEVMVVPDTLLDERFADNPLVTGEPRVRFYAGCPIRAGNEHHLGTLCVIDTRPRQFDHRQIALLRDLARLVENGLAA